MHPEIPRGPEQRERGVRFIVGEKSIASARHPDRNEDAILKLPESGVFAVFDGVSGEYETGAGGMAAHLAGRNLKDALRNVPNNLTRLDAQRLLGTILRTANQEIIDEQIRRGTRDIQTTVSLVLFVEEAGQRFLVTGNIGDSRVYIQRAAGGLEQVTLDDNDYLRENRTESAARVLQTKLGDFASLDELSADEQRVFSRSNRISQTLGDPESEPRLHSTEIHDRERVLLSTDGVHDNLRAREMLNILQQADNPQDAAERLVAASKTRSTEDSPRAKPDDMTAIVVEIPASTP